VEGKAQKYDDVLMETVHRIDNPSLTRALHAVTQLGSHAAIGTAAGITALAMLKQGRREDAWTVVVSTGGAMAINTILKNIFQRQRPQELARRIKLPDSHSFPSGHSLLSAATYPIVVHHLVQKRSAAVQGTVHTIAALTVLTVGFSRVYFGVHFPSDVLGGFAAGFGWLGLTALSHTVVES
jgi:membrane-associated phospholipid phosphatase